MLSYVFVAGCEYGRKIRGSDEVTYLKANGLDNILAAIATKSCPR